MLNSRHSAGESGSFNPSAILVTAIAICGITLAAATLRAPAAPTAVPSAVAASDTAYLPAQIINQALEIEPMPETF